MYAIVNGETFETEVSKIIIIYEKDTENRKATHNTLRNLAVQRPQVSDRTVND